MIFAGSNTERDIAKEREINFSLPFSQLVHINLKTAKPKIITEQTEQETKNGTADNLPCILLSKEKYDLKTAQPKTLIVYLGGNGETNYNSRGYEFFFLAKEDSDVLIVGYPGYPGSRAQASPENFYLHTEVLAKSLSSFFSTLYKKIIIIGWSIGCAAAINTTLCAQEKTISHLTLINGFTNIIVCAKHLITRQFPFAGLFPEQISSNISNRFDNKSRIEKITTPLTIIYTPKDDFVYNKDSTTLYNAAKTCKDKILKEIPGDHIQWDSSLVYNIITLHSQNRKSEIDKTIEEYKKKEEER